MPVNEINYMIISKQQLGTKEKTSEQWLLHKYNMKLQRLAAMFTFQIKGRKALLTAITGLE